MGQSRKCSHTAFDVSRPGWIWCATCRAFMSWCARCEDWVCLRCSGDKGKERSRLVHYQGKVIA